GGYVMNEVCTSRMLPTTYGVPEALPPVVAVSGADVASEVWVSGAGAGAVFAALVPLVFSLLLLHAVTAASAAIASTASPYHAGRRRVLPVVPCLMTGPFAWLSPDAGPPGNE